MKNLLFSLLLLSWSTISAPFYSLVREAVMNDPAVMEARAELNSAQSRTEQARSAHWPVITATGSKLLSQSHRYSYDYDSEDILPGIRGEVNIFASGAIEADVRRSESEAEYYHYKVKETGEERIRSFVSLYLDALREKQSIEVLKQSLSRHNSILNDLNTISIHDTGRESEFVQADARRLMVRQQLNTRNRVLKSTLGKLSTWTINPVTEADLENPFSLMTESRLLTDFTQAPQTGNPSWLASQADVESKKAALRAQELARYPRIDLTGSVTRDDRQIGVNLSWDLFNRNASYGVSEKAAQIAAATGRLDSVARLIDETGRLSLITVRESRVEMETLRRQEQASAKVVDFYRLQFRVARKTLIELLNAENELYSVGLSRVQTEDQMLHGMLDYLYSQGMLLKWSGVNLSDAKNNGAEGQVNK
ncbi:TolC family protein [Escherichia coli]|uniref:TolC family protein n=2 Tax=Escherichia coli TaxID=562 RepID=UPI00053B6A50|nr:TolC family protein [Escherichia coli]EER0917694.1 TolC family protein [Escherichia coli O168:H8]EES8553562.1 TolC family protein [Escherichia coli O168]EEV2702891.1 TolC family protein [Escherichia coli O174:H21]EKE4533187.1 TolC family protein [Escherichia coli O157]EKE4541007.1 TolC family protein [Escherichia coli O103]EKK3458826.1 TolC family protein [Escherichia coli O174]